MIHRGLQPRVVEVAIATIAAITIAGCASTTPTKIPAYQPPAPSASMAEIFGAGTSGHLWRVDGAETAAFSRSTRVTPGDHLIGANCLSDDVTWMASTS